MRFSMPELRRRWLGKLSWNRLNLTAAQGAKEALVASCAQKSPDLDQLSEGYAMLRKALAGSKDKEADKARSRAG